MRSTRLSFLTIISVYIICTFSLAGQNLTLSRDKSILFEKQLNSTICNIHTAVRPLIYSDELSVLTDSAMKDLDNKTISFFSHFLSLQKKSKTNISINGILDAQIGAERTRNISEKYFLDGGLSINGKINNKLFLNVTFIALNSSFPSYLDSFISNKSIIPGTGSAYSSKVGYSNQYYSGYLSYSPNKIFNFQIGKDKHFFGDGYRSLFLSDVSNSYPYFQISTKIRKIQYTSLFTWMKDVSNPSHLKKDFLNKYGTFHYLSWNITKRINLSLFESIIWQGTDSNRARDFDVNYLNPVVFFRPVEYSLGSSDNAFLGFAFKIKAAKKLQVYSQLLLDELLVSEIRAMKGWWGNKQGAQLGIKYFDLLNIINLSFQTEVNAVRPYTYSHGSTQQNYSNFNEPLADPLGANFIESVTFLNYHYKKWMFETEFLYAKYGKDKNGQNYGRNIFESYSTHPHDYGNKILQGLQTDLIYIKTKISYCLIPSSGLTIEAGVTMRQEKNMLSTIHSNFYYAGIKTNILNRYTDF